MPFPIENKPVYQVLNHSSENDGGGDVITWKIYLNYFVSFSVDLLEIKLDFSFK